MQITNPNSAPDEYEPQTSGDTTTKEHTTTNSTATNSDDRPKEQPHQQTDGHFRNQANRSPASAASTGRDRQQKLEPEAKRVSINSSSKTPDGSVARKVGGNMSPEVESRADETSERSDKNERGRLNHRESNQHQLNASQKQQLQHHSKQRNEDMLTSHKAHGSPQSPASRRTGSAAGKALVASSVGNTAASGTGRQLGSSAGAGGAGSDRLGAPTSQQTGGHRAYLASDNERHKRKLAKARERRATLILGLIMAAFICSWLPFFTFYVLRAVCHVCRDYISQGFEAFIFWMGYCNSAINPIIYTIFNRDFRRAFRKILFKCLVK